jgi:cell division protein ZapA
MSDNQFIDVKVMGYEFRVACPIAEIDLLKQAVQLLNHRIEEIKASGKMVGADRIAMMAALSLSHDYLKISGTEAFDITAVKGKIANMNNLIDTALNKSTNKLS